MYWAVRNNASVTLENGFFIFDQTDNLYRQAMQGGSIMDSNCSHIRFEDFETGAKFPHELIHYNPESGRIITAVRLGEVAPDAMVKGRLKLDHGPSQNAVNVWSGYEAAWLGADGVNRAGDAALNLTPHDLIESEIWPHAAGFDGRDACLKMNSDGFIDGWEQISLEVVARATETGTDRRLIAAGADSDIDPDHSLLLRYDNRRISRPGKGCDHR